MHQGFTHFSESTFDSIEGVKEYIENPEHVEYANELSQSHSIVFCSAMNVFFVLYSVLLFARS
jgi:hypothetical protein